MNGDLMAAFLETIAERLRPLGYAKGKDCVFIGEATREVVGWIGFNVVGNRRTQSREINTVIGVRHQLIERELCELLAERHSGVIPPTVSQHLGYLTPARSYSPVSIPGVGRAPVTPERLIREIETFGLPFIEQNQTLRGLVDTIGAGSVGLREHLVLRAPLAYRHLGNHEMADRVIAQHLAFIGARDDQAARRFRRFADAFSGTS